MGKKSQRPVLVPPQIFNVFKPVGWSSFEVVSYFKKNLAPGFGKICHFGTLDPFASGVLLIGIAGASRLNDIIHELHPKTYIAVGRLDLKTNSGDRTGVIVEQRELSNKMRMMSALEIENILVKALVGEYWQRPPAFSASKHNGKPLYQYARSGVNIEKNEVLRKIHSLRVLKYAPPFLTIECSVSSGTYVRSLFEECAKHLGQIGSLVALQRIAVGSALVNNSLRKSEWPKLGSTFSVSCVVPIDAIAPYTAIRLEDNLLDRFRGGAIVELPSAAVLDDGRYWITNSCNELVALIEKHQKGYWQIFSFSKVP